MTYIQKLRELLHELEKLQKEDMAIKEWFEPIRRKTFLWSLFGTLGDVSTLEELKESGEIPSQEERDELSWYCFASFGDICGQLRQDSFEKAFQFIHSFLSYPDFKQFEQEVDKGNAGKIEKIFTKISWLLLWKWYELKKPASENLSDL